MAVDPNDPRPQATIDTVGGSRRTEPRGAYVDQSLTVRNLAGQASTAADPTDPPNVGATRVYNPAGWQKSGFSEQAAPPAAKPYWRTGRDPYANNGMVGQDFFKNS